MRLNSQAGEKLGDFFLTHLNGMTLVVEEDKPLDPADIRFLSPWAVVAGADRLADLIEQPGFRCGRRRRVFRSRLPALTYHFESMLSQC